MALQVTQILSDNRIDYLLAFGTLLGSVRIGSYFPWDDDFDLFLFDNSYDEAIELLKEELPNNLLVHGNHNDPFYFKAWNTIKNLDTRVVMNQTYHVDNYLLQYPNIHIDLYRLKKLENTSVEEYKRYEYEKFLRRKLDSKMISIFEYEREVEILNQQHKIEQNSKKYDSNNKDLYMFMLKLKQPIDAKSLFPLKRYKFDGHYFLGPNNAELILKSSYEDYQKLPPIDKRASHYKKVIFI